DAAWNSARKVSTTPARPTRRSRTTDSWIHGLMHRIEAFAQVSQIASTDARAGASIDLKDRAARLIVEVAKVRREMGNILGSVTATDRRLRDSTRLPSQSVDPEEATALNYQERPAKNPEATPVSYRHLLELRELCMGVLQGTASRFDDPANGLAFMIDAYESEASTTARRWSRNTAIQKLGKSWVECLATVRQYIASITPGPPIKLKNASSLLKLANTRLRTQYDNVLTVHALWQKALPRSVRPKADSRATFFRSTVPCELCIKPRPNAKQFRVHRVNALLGGGSDSEVLKKDVSLTLGLSGLSTNINVASLNGPANERAMIQVRLFERNPVRDCRKPTIVPLDRDVRADGILDAGKPIWQAT
ncbi:hypothetical protein CLF_110933, partial [Clonorchis sinensis]